MADSKISQLASGAPAALNQVVPIYDPGSVATKSLTLQQALAVIGLLPSGAPAAGSDVLAAARSGTAVALAISDILNMAQRRNLIINGAFDIDQRLEGTAYANTTTAAYAIDRWFAKQATTAQSSMQRVALPTALSGFGYGWKCLLTGTSTGQITFGQIVEAVDVTKYQGRSVVVTVRALKGSTWNPSNVGVLLTTGTGTDQGLASLSAGTWTTQANTLNANMNPTTSWATFTLGPVTIPAACTELAVQFTATPTGGVPDANSYLIITGVEIKDAAVAAFDGWERRDYASELWLCQRYYEKSFQPGTVPAQNVGTPVGCFCFPAVTAGATVQRSGNCNYMAVKRVTPNLTFFNPNAANAQARDSTGSVDCSATAVNINAVQYFSLNTTGNAATAVNNRLTIHWTADAELV